MARNNNPKKRKSLPLPLEWTRISRDNSKQRRKKEDNNENDFDFMSCCESCPPTEIRRNSASAHHIREQTQEINDNEVSHPLSTTLNGKGVFCLHSLDTDWFQGYFIPDKSNSNSNLNSKRKPLELLAVNRNDVDDCLQCSDGGYREIDLTVFSKSSPKEVEDEESTSNVKEKKQFIKKRKTQKWTRMICTCGDMLCFSESTTPITTGNSSSGSRRQDGKLRFEAEKVLTGEKVEPFMKRYFSNLL